MAGRKTECNSEITEQIAKNIALGLSNRDAATLAGIGETAFYNWIRRGEIELSRVLEAPTRRSIKEQERPFVQFAQAIKRAVPLRKQALIDVIKQAAHGGETLKETKKVYKDGVFIEEIITEKTRASEWTAAAWLLERLHYDEFGKRNRVDVYDWRKEVKEMLDSGAITPEDIESELGTDIAKEFFESVGLHYVGSGQAETQSEKIITE